MANDYSLWLGLQAVLVDFASRLRSGCDVKPTNHLRFKVVKRKSTLAGEDHVICFKKETVLQQFWELEAIELAFENEGTEWHGSLLGKWLDVETVEAK